MKNREYPENREWKQKAFGIPKLPSGDIGQDKVLYYILKMVKDGKSANTMLNIEGSNSTATLGRMCEWIRPIGLVNKEKQVWTLTELGEMVLERQDSCFSTAVFCSTIVFMGEILFYLQKPKNSQELLKIAEEYHLNWKTNSEIHNRIKWFRDVDMVRFEEYKLEYSLTQKGEEFLQQIEVTMPSEIEEERDETLLETQLPMSEWASALKPATTEKKRMAIGYMPGKTADACITISAFFSATRLLTLQTRLSVAYKGVIALLYKEKCRDFMNDTTIDIVNSMLESPDIHHIFPEAYCVKMRIERKYYNSIVNKTPILPATNRSIGGRAPSEYTKNILKKVDGLTEDVLKERIESHCINYEALVSDDFHTYLIDRAKKILGLIEKAMGKPVSDRDADTTVEQFGEKLV